MKRGLVIWFIFACSYKFTHNLTYLLVYFYSLHYLVALFVLHVYPYAMFTKTVDILLISLFIFYILDDFLSADYCTVDWLET